MYSSFKKYQLITESWRRFLNEISDEEKKYFGDWIDENYLNQISQKLFGAWTGIEIDTKFNFQPFGKGVLNFLGNGTFRAAYAPIKDTDFVIKFAINKKGKAMNQREFQLHQDRTGLFPKVFKHSEDFSWIVVESIQVIKEQEDFVDYFYPLSTMFNELGYDDERISEILANTLFEPEVQATDNDVEEITLDILGLDEEEAKEARYNENTIYYEEIFLPVIEKISQSQFTKGTDEDKDIAEHYIELLMLYSGEFEILTNAIYALRVVGVNMIVLLSSALLQYANKIVLLRKIKDIIKKYNIVPREIRVRNTGVNKDGQFRIIDASVKDDITAIDDELTNPPRSKPADKTIDFLE